MRGVLLLLALAACAPEPPAGLAVGGAALGGRGAVGAGGGGRVLICGDGIVSSPETCDDGNTTAGDGCSAACATEYGYTCTGSPSTCTGGGIAGLSSALTINSITVAAPILDWRGADCSSTAAAGSPGCVLHSGQMLTVSGTSNLTFNATSGTNGTSDKGVAFVGGASDGYLSGIGSDGDVTTEDILLETVRKDGDRSSAHMVIARLGATDGFEFFNTTSAFSRFTTASTNTDFTPGYATSATGKWEYCTECIDRSSSTGASMWCNGQRILAGSSISARSASLTNTTALGIGGTNNGGTHFPYNGTLSMVRLYRQAGWFSSSESECKTVHRARIRGLSLKRYLFLGDSITFGVGVAGVQRAFSSKYGESGTSLIATVNAGIAGERCDQIITDEWATEKVFSPIVAGGYTRMYLDCGINDVNADHAAATIEADITTLVTQAKALGMAVYVGTLMPYKNNVLWTSGRETVRTTVNTWILANSVGATGTVDYSAALTDGASPPALAAADDSGDGLHPNQTGMDLMASTLTAAIAP